MSSLVRPVVTAVVAVGGRVAGIEAQDRAVDAGGDRTDVHRQGAGHGDGAGAAERPVVAEPRHVVRPGVPAERDRPVAGVTRLPAFTLVDPIAVVWSEQLRDLRVHRRRARDRRRRGLVLQDVPRLVHLHQAVALLVRLVAGDELRRRRQRLLQLLRRRCEAVLQRGRDEERRRARRHRRGHRCPLDHLVPRRELVDAHADTAGERVLRHVPRRPCRELGARADDVRLQAAVFTRAARGERPHRVVLRHARAVVGRPRVRGLVRAAADCGVGSRRRSDRVRARPVVAVREEELHVEDLGDQVDDLRLRVVRVVVQRGQAADRHLDDVHVIGADQVQERVDLIRREAPRDEQADAGDRELRVRGDSIELAAEEAVAGDGAGDVRAVAAGDDADVDHACVGLRLHDERDRLDDALRADVVLAEVVDVTVDGVVPHRRVVREVLVLVDVDPDDLRLRVLEDAERVARVAVAVDVAAELAAEPRIALGEDAELERVGRVLERDRQLVLAGARVDVLAVPCDRDVRQRHPGRVAVRRVAQPRGGLRRPVVDLRNGLALQVLRGLQLGPVEVDARVDDADLHTAAVVRRMRGDELRRVDPVRRHERVDTADRRRRDDPAAGRAALTLGLRIDRRHGPVDVHGEDAGRLRGRDRLVRRHLCDEVADLVVLRRDLRAERRELARHVRGVARPGRDEQRHRRLPGCLGLRDERDIRLAKALPVVVAGLRHGAGRKHGNGRECEHGGAARAQPPSQASLQSNSSPLRTPGRHGRAA